FTWESTTDVDDITLETTLHLLINGNETVLYPVGQSHTLNIFASNLPYGESIQWWVEVSDGDTLTLANARNFTVSTGLYHNGPSWVVDPDGSDTNGNGSTTYPFKTIQHGLDAAAANDTIKIKTGTYTENLSIQKSVVIDGITQFGVKPIINGNDTGRIITAGDTAAVTVNNIAFKEGYFNDYGGGAIYSYYEPIYITNCNFIDNNVAGSGRGGAIESHNINSVIKHCYFEDNHSL
ncbi:uncharacterized protein METZ01_LOCUS498433, partial [marine metagenome]